MRYNPDVEVSTRIMDDKSIKINRLYQIAEISGNWEPVACFELDLFLKALQLCKAQHRRSHRLKFNAIRPLAS